LDLRAHLEWSGERADDDKFKLLSLEAPDGPATVGTTFSSSGTADNGTFHDRSVVTEATRPHRFVIETDSRLERTRGRTWEVHFIHRYDIDPDADGSRIVYYGDRAACELPAVLAAPTDQTDLPAVRESRRPQTAHEPRAPGRGTLGR
jgi:hypothetical protein